MRYLRWGGRGFCLGAGKTRSEKNARKCRRIPSVQCTLCWANPILQDSPIENQNQSQLDLILHATKFLAMLTLQKPKLWKNKNARAKLAKTLAEKMTV